MALRIGAPMAMALQPVKNAQRSAFFPRLAQGIPTHAQPSLECNLMMQNISRITGKPVSARMAREIEAICSLAPSQDTDYLAQYVFPAMFEAKPGIGCGFLAEIRRQASLLPEAEVQWHLCRIVEALHGRSGMDADFMKEVTFQLECFRPKERYDLLKGWVVPFIFSNQQFGAGHASAIRLMFEATPSNLQGELVHEVLSIILSSGITATQLAALAGRFESLPATDRLYFARQVAIAAGKCASVSPALFASILDLSESKARGAAHFPAAGKPAVFGTSQTCPDTLPNFKKAFLFRAVSAVSAYLVAGRFTLCTNAAQAEYDFRRSMVVLTPESISRLRCPPSDRFAIFDKLGRPYFVKISGNQIEIFNYRKATVYAKNAPGADKCVDSGTFALYEPGENRFYSASHWHKPLCLFGHRTRYWGDRELQRIAKEMSQAEAKRRMQLLRA